jgi:23S rRNA pseudouridine1911/1915/1917 synthase
VYFIVNDSQLKTWVVQESENGQRLDAFLAHHLEVSRSVATKLATDCFVNKKPRKGSYSLKTGDVVQSPEVEKNTGNKSEHAPIVRHEFPPILFEDEHLIIVNKPRGLTVHAGAGEQETLVDLLRQRGTPLSSLGEEDRAGIVHRLDKDTSGVIVICKTNEAHEILAADFAERRVKKIYKALVCGAPPQQGRIDAPIFRHPVQRKKMAVIATGRHAVTDYKVLLSWHQFALVEIDLKTGRTHQIRVHFQYINHPVVGDSVYGGYNRAIAAAKSEELKNALKNMHHQALHAAQIQLQHPVTKVLLDIEAPLPDDIQNLMELLSEEKVDSR